MRCLHCNRLHTAKDNRGLCGTCYGQLEIRHEYMDRRLGDIARDAEIVRLLQQGHSDGWVAKQFGMTRQCVRRRRLRFKVDCEITKTIPRHGSANPQAKMTEAEVRELRALRARNPGVWTYHRLAEKFGLCVATVHDAVQRKTWRHVEG